MNYNQPWATLGLAPQPQRGNRDPNGSQRSANFHCIMVPGSPWSALRGLLRLQSAILTSTSDARDFVEGPKHRGSVSGSKTWTKLSPWDDPVMHLFTPGGGEQSTQGRKNRVRGRPISIITKRANNHGSNRGLSPLSGSITGPRQNFEGSFPRQIFDRRSTLRTPGDHATVGDLNIYILSRREQLTWGPSTLRPANGHERCPRKTSKVEFAMLPSYVMGLVEHVRPPRLDLRNAEIEVISRKCHSLRATLPFSASDTAQSTERSHLLVDDVEQKVHQSRIQVRTTCTVCVVRNLESSESRHLVGGRRTREST